MICIKGARMLDPASHRDEVADIVIGNDGRIAYIGPDAQRAMTGKAETPADVLLSALGNGNYTEAWFDEVISAEGLVAAPGLVDIHAHFRDPGQTWKEDIHTGAAAAAAGGYTTVVCMANTVPPVDNTDVLCDLLAREKELPVHVLQTANVTMGMKGETLTDMDALAAAGAAGFTDDGIPITDEGLLLAALQKAKELDLPISLHEEMPSLNASNGIHQGPVSEALGVGGAPAVSEEILVARDCLLNRRIGALLDIQHVSSGGTVEILRAMKAMGVRVVAEVTPQHLSATQDLVLSAGMNAKVNPPLRTEEDRQKLIDGLIDGTLDVIATDHAPHSKEEKAQPPQKAPSGMIGLETALALCITNLVEPGYLTLSELLLRMSTRPAEIYGLPAGSLSVGSPADIVLFDPKEQWTVTEEGFHSRSCNSPFIGMTLTGKVKMTICGGAVVYA